MLVWTGIIPAAVITAVLLSFRFDYPVNNITNDGKDNNIEKPDATTDSTITSTAIAAASTKTEGVK